MVSGRCFSLRATAVALDVVKEKSGASLNFSVGCVLILPANGERFSYRGQGFPINRLCIGLCLE